MFFVDGSCHKTAERSRHIAAKFGINSHVAHTGFSEDFIINFVYSFPDDRDIIFDDTIYNIKIYVTDRDGTLEANMIASKGEEKYSRLIFVNTEKGGDEPTTNPTDSSYKGDSPLDINRNPKTGDDARMELSFLFAMIASAGLLTLSIVYLIDTRKMINRKNKEDN